MLSATDGERVRVFPFRKGGANGYDLSVTSPDATVEDYLVAVDSALRRLPLTLSRNASMRCQGCAACCEERVPLTSIDLLQLTRRSGPNDDLFTQVADVVVKGRTVDIVLKRNEQGRCLFLDAAKGLCRVYRSRPLVCRTFVCCPVSARARELRGAVTNAGEDELVRLWLEKQPPPPGIIRADWYPGVFTGRLSYKEVRLRDLVQPSLWRRLFEKRKSSGHSS